MVSIFKQVLLLLLKVLYSFKWHGVELLKIPERTVLIVSHISWIDALFFLPFLNDKWLVILPPSYEKKNFLRKLISLLVRTDSADLYFQVLKDDASPVLHYKASFWQDKTLNIKL